MAEFYGYNPYEEAEGGAADMMPLDYNSDGLVPAPQQFYLGMPTQYVVTCMQFRTYCLGFVPPPAPRYFDTWYYAIVPVYDAQETEIYPSSAMQHPIADNVPLETGDDLPILSVSKLARASVEEQKHIVGKHLQKMVQEMYPDLADAITDTLLELGTSEVLLMLEEREYLQIMMEDAVIRLRSYSE